MKYNHIHTTKAIDSEAGWAIHAGMPNRLQ